jgi:hypothetical protein
MERMMTRYTPAELTGGTKPRKQLLEEIFAREVRHNSDDVKDFNQR